MPHGPHKSKFSAASARASGPLAAALRASAAENRRLHALIDQLRAEAQTDCLTALPNRRALECRLTEVWSAAVRHGQDLAYIALDIDGLKRVNDTLGHAAGDDLIRTVAQTLRECIRASDFAARTGGDEFVVLLPMTNIQGAQLLADRIAERFQLDTARLRATLDEHPFSQVRVVIPTRQHPDGRTAHIGISTGVSARLADACSTPKAMLDTADARLYHAKRSRKRLPLAA
ncbi:MAG: GGDEF domain-containing protein [Phycisphaeraceae bacterium]|nr:GGDEF domain-containing protein [Phycisphaeraceae bacterium]